MLRIINANDLQIPSHVLTSSLFGDVSQPWKCIYVRRKTDTDRQTDKTGLAAAESNNVNIVMILTVSEFFSLVTFWSQLGHSMGTE